MTIHDRAVRHAWRMLDALMVSVGVVLGLDAAIGHSNVAFAAAIIGLMVANAPMLRLNCPRCGQNAFVRGVLVLPWPRRICTRCRLDLGQAGGDSG